MLDPHKYQRSLDNVPLPRISLPAPRAYDLEAYAAPGHWFFCRRVEIPLDLEPGEEEGYVLLELENLSPFPLAHMHYGLVFDDERRYAFMYAAYKRRLEQVDMSGWRHLDAVVPDFLVALKAELEDGQVLVLRTEDSLLGFRYDGLSSLPAEFVAQERAPLQELGAEDEALEGALPEQAEEQGEGSGLGQQDPDFDDFVAMLRQRFGGEEPNHWQSSVPGKWVGATACFGALPAGEDGARAAVYSRSELWIADIRDSEMLDLARQDVRQNALLWKGLLAFAAIVVLMLFSEFWWVGSKAHLSSRLGAVEDRAPEVVELEDLRSTSEGLRRFQESNLSPFVVIETLYPLQQYPKVVYKKFETSGPNGLVIDARADNQTEVTRFKQRLEAFEKVRSVELSNLDNNPQGSTFTARIEFEAGAFLVQEGES